MKIKLLSVLPFVFLAIATDLTGQIWQSDDYREKYYARIKRSHQYYVDIKPDTLIFEGKIYFFRQTPLCLKKGYTDVYHHGKEVIIDSKEPEYNRTEKGYTLTWVIRNDSLYIQNIRPDYIMQDGVFKNKDGRYVVLPDKSLLPDDTIVSRMEKFVGNRFKHDLLYVKWVAGDFGVIDSYDEPDRKPYQISYVEKYKNMYQEGSVIRIKNGKFKKMKKDDRKQRN